jgi:uncharacterized protein (DUF1499 family)
LCNICDPGRGNHFYIALLLPGILGWFVAQMENLYILALLNSSLFQYVTDMKNEIPTQVLIRTLNKKPGYNDTNFQVVKARLEAVKLMAEKV